MIFRDLALVLTLNVVAIFSATAAPANDAASWQEMARTDLEAVRGLIEQGHPGAIDTENPSFNDWVEQGYTQAKALIPYVMSYDTAMSAVRFYTTGFKDGHLLYSDNARKDYPTYVTGWNVVREKGEYRVATVLPDWPTPLPPKRAIWNGCDGLSAEETMRSKVAPFADRRAGDGARELHMAILWQQQPTAENLQACVFETQAGKLVHVRVSYQPICTKQFFASFRNGRNGASRNGNRFDIHGGVAWVRAGNFSLRADSADSTELETMLSGLAKLRGVKAIVFDARGNGGGDSGVGDKIFEAATGGLEYDQADIDTLPRYFAQWRVSDFALSSLSWRIGHWSELYGTDSPRVSETVEFRDSMLQAKAAGQSWVEQDAGFRITRDDIAARHGQLQRNVGKIALITDSGCASACLDFADTVLQVPGAIHLGKTTGADSVYLDIGRSTLPSGNVLIMPMKVWRNRARGNNQPHIPNIPLNMDDGEPKVQRAVLKALDL